MIVTPPAPRTIGFWAPAQYYAHFATSELLLGFNYALRIAVEQAGYKLRVFDRQSSARALLSAARHGRIHGFIGIVQGHEARFHRCWRALEDLVPCVSAYIPTGRPASHHVGMDDREAAAMLVRHLHSEGHRRIGYVGYSPDTYSALRFEGYRDALRALGLPFHSAWVLGFDERARPSPLLKKILDLTLRAKWHSEHRTIALLFTKFLAADLKPSAILFDGSYLAHPFRRALTVRGLSVPENLAIAVVDERATIPRRDAFTSCEQDHGALARTAFERLRSLLEGRPVHGKQDLLRPILRVRRSSLKKSLKVRGMGGFRETVLEYLGAHFADGDALGRLPEILGITGGYFTQRFVKTFSEPFRPFVNRMRLDAAARALEETAEPVTAILHRVGFHNYQNFSTAFRRQYGMAPGAFRRLKQA